MKKRVGVLSSQVSGVLVSVSVVGSLAASAVTSVLLAGSIAFAADGGPAPGANAAGSPASSASLPQNQVPAQAQNQAPAPSQSQAQPKSLDLKSALAEGETNSPELKRLRSVAEKTSWEKMAALSGYMPHVAAGYDHFLNSDYMRENIVFGGSTVTFPAAYPQDSLTLDASITVFDGFDSYYKYRSAGLRTEAAELELARAKFQLENSVSNAFYQALASQKLLDVAKQNVLTLKQHLDRAQLTARTGYGTRFDVLRIEATLQEATADEQLAENNQTNAREALQVAMGVEGSDLRPLKGDLPILKQSDVPADLNFAINQRDDLRAQLKRIDSAKADGVSADAFFYPSVSVFAEENLYKFGSFSNVVLPDSAYQSASSVGLRLKWNLFDGGASYARRHEAASVEYEQRQLAQRAMIAIPKEVSKWQRQFYYSVSLYSARLKSVSEYEESVRLAGIGVKAGSNTHTEMLDAELDLFRARGGLVKAQAQMIESYENLELALGQHLGVKSGS